MDVEKEEDTKEKDESEEEGQDERKTADWKYNPAPPHNLHH